MDSYTFPGSTRIESGKYDSESETVHLLFPDGVRWAYYKVPEKTWKQFKRASSAGHFLAEVLDGYKNSEDKSIRRRK